MVDECQFFPGIAIHEELLNSIDVKADDGNHGVDIYIQVLVFLASHGFPNN